MALLGIDVTHLFMGILIRYLRQLLVTSPSSDTYYCLIFIIAMTFLLLFIFVCDTLPIGGTLACILLAYQLLVWIPDCLWSLSGRLSRDSLVNLGLNS